MTGADWDSVTFEGARRATAARVAAAPPEQRLAWLEEALELASASGALARIRRQRQADIDERWAGEAGA